MKMHAKDMSVVTEKTVQGRRLWKRGKFGRALPVMRLVHNGQRTVIDPQEYSDNIVKLNVPYIHTSVTDLDWSWETVSEVPAEFQQSEDESGNEVEEKDVMQVDNVQAETTHAMSILNQMLGEEQTEQEDKPAFRFEWKSTMRYDPDEHASSEDEGENVQPADRHYQVADDIKALFTTPSAEEPFRLFGFDVEEEEEAMDTTPNFYAQPSFQVPSTKLFLHMDDAVLAFSTPPLSKEEWLEQRETLLRDAKSKSKLAAKRKKRM
jgi:hypothetical protein